MQMDLENIKQTDIWTLYDQAVNYCRLRGMFTDVDICYRMYGGDQWAGLKVKGVEKVQYNIIKPIVRYKTGVVLQNLFAIHYSSQNIENAAFQKYAEKLCSLLNQKAFRIWENDYMDLKLRNVVKDAAITGEGIIYVRFDEETGLPVNEILNKTDIFYGNENDSDIQSQPYILIKQRKPVSEVQEIAIENGVPSNQINLIMGDLETAEEAGEDAKQEKDGMVTVITKLYKEKGTVHFAQATRCVDIKKDTDTGLTYYPVAHLLWEEKKGSARGEGEVRNLLPNQLEINKTAMRRAVAVRDTTFPQKVVNIDMITNPADLDKPGGTIKVSGGMTVDDVNKIITTVTPRQMSTDAEKLQNELIQTTRELAGAGEIATGEINPEAASGRAILAVQQASQQPLTEHLEFVKVFGEDLARIWLDGTIVYNDVIVLEEEVTDPMTGDKQTVATEVLKDSLIELQANVRVDITPRGAFDKYAQEMSLENLLTAGMLTSQRMPELKLYVRLLDDDSVMPKQKLEELLDYWEQEQQKIAAINAQSQMMSMQARQFLSQMQAGEEMAVATPGMPEATGMPGQPVMMQ